MFYFLINHLLIEQNISRAFIENIFTSLFQDISTGFLIYINKTGLKMNTSKNLEVGVKDVSFHTLSSITALCHLGIYNSTAKILP